MPDAVRVASGQSVSCHVVAADIEGRRDLTKEAYA
jgi:hypothetical protein